MGSKTGVGGTAIPPIDPPPPKWHPPPPSGKALYVGLESVLGIGEGVPIPIPGGRSLPGGWVVGTVRAVRNPLPSATGRAPSFQVRSHPAATCAVVLVGIPRSARYDNAYYQTLSKSAGVGPEGETSTRTWGRFPPGEAGGRLGVPRRSISCSLSLTAELTREARCAGSRPGAIASWCTISSSRFALRTMRPGRVSLAAARTDSFRTDLLARLCGLTLGATDSSLGMTQTYKNPPRFQPHKHWGFRKICA